MKELYRFRQFLTESVTADEIASRVRKLGKEKGIEDKYIEDYIDELDGNFEPDAYENSTDKDLLDDLKSYIDLSEGVIKKEVTINGKTIDVSSIKIEGVDTSQGYDDGTTDAFASYAEFKDGSELSDNELDKLTDENPDLIHELALEVFQMGESTPGYKELKEGHSLDSKDMQVLKDAFNHLFSSGSGFTKLNDLRRVIKYIMDTNAKELN